VIKLFQAKSLQVHKAWDSVSISTNFVVSAVELEVIKQWLKKVAGLTTSTVVEPCLPQSKLFLKILGVSYWGNNSSLSITQAQVEAVIANTPVFEEVVFASHPPSHYEGISKLRHICDLD